MILAEHRVAPYTVRVTTEPEELDIGELWTNVDTDLDELRQRIDEGTDHWCILSVEVAWRGRQLATESIGGVYIRDADIEHGVFNDYADVVENLTDVALQEADDRLVDLNRELQRDIRHIVTA